MKNAKRNGGKKPGGGFKMTFTKPNQRQRAPVFVPARDPLLYEARSWAHDGPGARPWFFAGVDTRHHWRFAILDYHTRHCVRYFEKVGETRSGA